MSKQRSTSADYVVYLIIRLMVCIIQALPYRAGTGFASLLAWLAFHIDTRHTNVARDNLQRAFPGQFNDREIDRMVQAVYVHFCTLVVDIIHLPRKLNPHTWRRHLE